MTRLSPKTELIGHRLTVGSGCLALALLAASVMSANAENLRVLDQLVLGETRISGEKIGEFSAMVRDPAGSGVLAISDRGYIAEFALEIADDRLARLEPVAVHVLTAADGTDMRDKDFNAEGAALLDDGSIAIVDEAGPTLAVFDRTGKWLRDEALPLAVQHSSRQASDKDGIEAISWTVDTGFLAMTEEPQLGEPRNLHTLHSILAPSVQISVPEEESISIKSMEAVGTRLFILERTRDDVTDALTPWLRIVDLPDCAASAFCTGTQLPITVEGITHADFEGLAELRDGLFLMVSDDKIDGDLRSVFVLFRVE
jgi:hypothetical protein